MKSRSILRDRPAKKNCINRSAILLASFSHLDSAQKKYAGNSSVLIHEVRNPLCNIDLALEMLKATTLDGEQQQYLNIIMRGSGRINDLLTSLLTADQTEDVASESYSLRQLLEEVLVMAEDRILLKKIAVSREYASSEQEILLDKESMKIALTNIVINAIDAMPPEKGELKLVTRSIGKVSSIEIRDNGTGISNENLKRIFEPYFTKKPGGLGLGLSTTLDILRANHVRVDVRSEEGIGTCFILSVYAR